MEFVGAAGIDAIGARSQLLRCAEGCLDSLSISTIPVVFMRDRPQALVER